MDLIRVATADLNQIPLAWEHNTHTILEAIKEARARNVSVLCMPELCIPGYGCDDAFYAHHHIERSWEALDTIIPATKNMIVCVGLPTLYKNGLFNTAALLVDGTLLGLVAKKFLAGDGIYYEPRWFRAWPEGIQATIAHHGKEVPLGDLFFDVGGLRIGFEICEDAWVAERPGSHLSLHGIDLILNPSGSHFAFGKMDVRKRFVLEGSRAFGVIYVYANLLGNESGRMIFDGGGLIANVGELVEQGERFSFKDWVITDAVVDVDKGRMARQRTGSFTPSFEQNPSAQVRTGFYFPKLIPAVNQYDVDPWEESLCRKEEEFTRAVSLALFDYLRKSRSRGFVVSLSGGADSAAVSVLSALSIHMAVASIGLKGLKKKLPYIAEIQDLEEPKEIIKRMLSCAYQATAHSGDVTKNAARAIAQSLGADYMELEIDAIVHGYVALIENAIQRDLTWERDDITLQNIQARVRSPSIWMIANIRNALLLSTSNRSEAAVGYATMDGDTSGGVSPIAGIDKDFLRQWLRWMEVEGPKGFGPIPELHHINTQQPTAELRPQEAAQTDEGDLMPYALLDAIERAAIRDKLSPIDVFDLMHVRFAQYATPQLYIWVDRFFKLWSRNQWKRERYAPSFHLDDENLDPKTWCRWPILSGNFKEDLLALKMHVAKLDT